MVLRIVMVWQFKILSFIKSMALLNTYLVVVAAAAVCHNRDHDCESKVHHQTTRCCCCCDHHNIRHYWD